MTISDFPGGSIAEALGIHLDQFARRVDHLIAYAELTGREIDAPAPDPAGLLPITSSVGTRRFEVLVDTASALREAAQLALVSSPRRSRDLLHQAGDLYLEASLPFGMYLVAIAGGMSDRLARLLDQYLDNASGTPQQQLYLLLAGAAVAGRSPRLDRLLRERTMQSRHRNSNQPVGALGIPAILYWPAIGALLDGPRRGTQRDESLETIQSLLWSLARRHDEVVASARTNGYLWENLASPVDVIDLDVVGLAALAMRRFGVDQVLGRLGPMRGRRNLPVEFMHVQLAVHWSEGT